MSGRPLDGKCCKSCWYRGLVVITGIALRRPDKTGHFLTLEQKALKTDEVALGARQTIREGPKKTWYGADVWYVRSAGRWKLM